MSFGYRACVRITGLTVYSPSTPTGQEKPKNEDWAEFEARTWKMKCHYNKEGKVKIPAVAFKFALMTAAKRMGRIPGEGMKTWTAPFTGGVYIANDLLLEITQDQLRSETFSCHANGQRGSGTRVARTFPMIDEWGGVLVCEVFDSAITADAFMEAFRIAGMQVGVGRGRPENGLNNGRFRAELVGWDEIT